MRKEALLSSEIEGAQATLVDMFSFEQTGRSGWPDCADVEEVANYVLSINYAFGELKSETGLPISARLFNECHRRLMRGARGKNKQPGEMRRSQVWIGGARPDSAAFVPPPADRVRDLLADLERYIHADDALPKLLRIAAAHAQFETIHPYLDGNGRLGRMLIALLLSHWGLLDKPLFISEPVLEKTSGRLLRATQCCPGQRRLARLVCILSGRRGQRCERRLSDSQRSACLAGPGPAQTACDNARDCFRITVIRVIALSPCSVDASGCDITEHKQADRDEDH